MNKAPVILQVLPELRSGGVERGTVEIARAIVQAGGKSLVTSSGGPMASQIAQARAEHITLPLNTKNPLSLWLNAQRIAGIVRKEKVDILHARSRAPAWSAWMAAQKTKCRFMTTFHGTYGLYNEWKRKYNAIMTRGERVIAISQFIADHILQNYEVDPAKLRIIHRGVDLRLFNPANVVPQRIIALTQEWRLPDTLPLILFPGRISRWKGQDVFVRALAKLPHRHFFAVILGDDKGHERYREELEELIVHLNLGGHVRLARHTHHITEAYMLAKLVVATSIEPEAFGRVVLEAQAMGRPVIATNHGGPQETVVQGESGFLVEPGNVEELTSVMEHVLEMNETQMQELSERSVANAQQFSLELMCHKTIEVYKELL